MSSFINKINGDLGWTAYEKGDYEKARLDSEALETWVGFITTLASTN